MVTFLQWTTFLAATPDKLRSSQSGAQNQHIPQQKGGLPIFFVAEHTLLNTRLFDAGKSATRPLLQKYRSAGDSASTAAAIVLRPVPGQRAF